MGKSTVCTECGKRKPLGEFAIRSTAKAVYHTRCKKCHREYSRSHYEANQTYYKRKAVVSRQKCVAGNKQYIKEYLLEHPCIDCGESDIDVLEFDHLIPIGGPGRRVPHYLNYSRERLVFEIEKCEIRCSNCHLRRTRAQYLGSRHDW